MAKVTAFLPKSSMEETEIQAGNPIGQVARILFNNDSSSQGQNNLFQYCLSIAEALKLEENRIGKIKVRSMEVTLLTQDQRISDIDD